MPTLLHLDSSPLPTSISRELGAEFVKTWKAKHTDGKVIYRDLSLNPPKPVDTAWIYAAYTPEDSLTPEQKNALALSEELITELKQADEYVIGIAMHNFSVPASLKLWIDQIARRGRTFTYGSAGPQGLLVNKKATLIVASGGVYDSATPMGAYNFADPYLKAVLGFLGVTDIHVVAAGGVQQVLTGAIDRETFLKPNLELVHTAVA